MTESFSSVNLFDQHKEDQYPLFSDTLSSLESKLSQTEKTTNKNIQSDSLTNEEDLKQEQKECSQENNNLVNNTKPKGKCPRGTEPVDFLSLKRKDVVFKSIFRMMRRYYCQLLETTTGYNRKEK